MVAGHIKFGRVYKWRVIGHMCKICLLTIVVLLCNIEAGSDGSSAGGTAANNKSSLSGGKPRNGQQPCGLWPTVWVPASAASGGLKHWEKLSFRAEDLPPPPDEWEEVCLAESAKIAGIAKNCQN